MKDMSWSRAKIRGEKKEGVAYFLWLTFLGHRLYLGKPFILYLLTGGYFLLGWLADFFRIPVWVREYNYFVYLRETARDMSALVRRDAIRESQGKVVDIPAGGREHDPEGETGVAGVDILPRENYFSGGLVERLTMWARENPTRAALLGVVGLVVGISIVAAALTGGKEEDGKSPWPLNEAPTESGSLGDGDLPLELNEPRSETVFSSPVTLSGKTEPRARVVVSVNRGGGKELWAGEDGRFTCQVELEEGPNLLLVEAEAGERRGRLQVPLVLQREKTTMKPGAWP